MTCQEEIKKLPKKTKTETQSPTKTENLIAISDVKENQNVQNAPAHVALTNQTQGSSPSLDPFLDPFSSESAWDNQIVRFTAPSETVCLWANAAYNFLYKLQFARVKRSAGSTVQGPYRQFECPVCHQQYGKTPSHLSDCDLDLLLQQSSKIPCFAVY